MTTAVLKPWMREAFRHEGLREVPGKAHSPVIVGWLTSLKAWWRDDETPWCGVFVAHCMREAGQSLPKHWYRAKGWLDWGLEVGPVHGAVVVFERQGGGHVGLLVGKDPADNLLVLGGNQGNQVNVRTFVPDRVLGYRWPAAWPLPAASEVLPLLAFGQSSEGEA